jgi:hypothetical protein
MCLDLTFRDNYHVEYIEKIADLTSIDYLERLQPVTSRTWKTRGLTAMSFMDGNNLLDHGADRLFMAWHYNRARHIVVARSSDPNDQLHSPKSHPFVWDVLQPPGSFDLDDLENGKWALYH